MTLAMAWKRVSEETEKMMKMFIYAENLKRLVLCITAHHAQ